MGAGPETSRALTRGRLQFLPCTLWTLGLAGLSGWPDLSPAASTNEVHPDSIAAQEAFPEMPKLWVPFFEVRTSAGYKDNLLLSDEATERSGFVGAGADISLARLPLDGRQVNLLVSGDDRRYWGGRQIDHEDLALALAQGKMGLGTDWPFGLDLRYLYQDEVVDTSVTEANLESTRVHGHLAGALPNVRWNFARDTWAEVSGMAQRGWYAAPLDDYWEGGPKLALGRDYGQGSSLQLSYGSSWRYYDSREQTSLSGTNFPGTSLSFAQRELALAWQHHWDVAKRWRTGLRLAWQPNHDNGPGYYDYIRYFVAPQVRYAGASWDLKMEAKLTHYDFSKRPAASASSATRRQSTVAVNLRAQRSLGKGFKLFAEYEREQSSSNQVPATDEYRVNTVGGGVLFEF